MCCYLFYLIVAFNIELILAKIPCDPTSFQFVLAPEQVKLYKDEHFRIGNAEEIGCAINVSFKWELLCKELNVLKKYEFSSLVIKYPELSPRRKNILSFWKVPNAVTLFGSDIFVLRVSLVPRPTHFSSYRLHYFKILEEEIKFAIEGGNYVVHHIGTGSILLKTRASRESKLPFNVSFIQWTCVPSIGRYDVSYQLEWEILENHMTPDRVHNCSVIATPLGINRNLTDAQIIIIVDTLTRVDLAIICLDNCIQGNAFKETRLIINCLAACREDVAWTVDPFDELIQSKLVTEGKLLIIPGGTFTHGSINQVKAILGHDSVAYNLNYRIPRVNLTVKCIEFCFVRHRPIKLEVECDGECLGIEYKWEAYPLPAPWDWAYLDLSRNVSSSTYVFPPFFFPPQTGANVFVSFFDSHGNLSFYIGNYNSTLLLTCKQLGRECSNPDTFHPVTLRVVCIKNCDLPRFLWAFYPHNDRFNWTENSYNNNKMVIIPAKSYLPLEKVSAQLMVDETSLNKEIVFQYGPPANISIHCVRNCINNGTESTNPLKSVILKLVCWNYCTFRVSEIEWVLTPRPLVYDGDLTGVGDGSILFIPGGAYSGSSSVVVSGSVFGSSAAYYLNYTIPKPKISIYCKQNCFKPANPSVDMILYAVCEADCDNIDIKWQIKHGKPRFFWFDNVFLSFANRSIVIRDQVLQEYSNLTVTASSHPILSEARYSFDIALPHPVIVLECHVNCNPPWVHLPVIIIAKCLDKCFNISYDFQLRRSNIILPTKQYASVNNESLTLIANTFKDSDRVEVKVIVRSVYKILYLTFKQLKPVLSFSCKPLACNMTQNIFEEFSITVVCERHCFAISYTWAVDPPFTPQTWNDNVWFGLNNKSLHFESNTLNDSETLAIMVWTYGTNEVVPIEFEKPLAKIQIVCAYNCDFTNPFEMCLLKTLCSFNCHYVQYYKWSFDPLPIGYDAETIWNRIPFLPVQNEISLPQSLYKDGDIVNARTFSNTHDASYVIAFVTPAPVLEIICLLNCKYNPTEETVLKVICVRKCVVPYPYKWKTLGYPSLMDDYQIIRIKPFLIGHRENFTLHICKGKGCVKKTIEFVLPKISFKVSCTINCDQQNFAHPLKSTILMVECLKGCDGMNMNALEWTIDPQPEESDMKKKIIVASEKLILRGNIFVNRTCINVFATYGDETNSVRICFIIPNSGIYLKCTYNCGYPNPHYVTVYQVVCWRHCYRITYDWEVSPTGNYSATNDVLTIHRKAYEDRQKVFISATGGGAEAKKMLFFSIPLPVLKLECITQCTNVSVLRSVTLAVRCTANCFNLDIWWTIVPEPLLLFWAKNIRISRSKLYLTIMGGSYNNSITINVIANHSSSRADMYVSYIGVPRILSLSCLENCGFYPKSEVQIKAICNGPCGGLNIWRSLECLLDPKPVDTNLIILNDIILVPDNAYLDGDIVLLNCSLLLAIDTLILTFRIDPWLNGSCELIPMEGVGGITLHNIQCKGFAKDATYFIYQKSIVNDPQAPLMLLIVSLSPITPPFLTGPCINCTFEVHIGLGWQIFNKLQLTAHIFNILKENQREPSLYENRVLEGLAVIVLEMTDWRNQKMFELFHNMIQLIKKNKFDNACQLAYSIVVSAANLPFEAYIFFKKRLLLIYMAIVDEVEVMSTLLLIENMMYQNASSLRTLNYKAKIVYMAVQSVKRGIEMKRQYHELALIAYAQGTIRVIANIVVECQRLFYSLPKLHELKNDFYYFDINVRSVHVFSNLRDVVMYATRAIDVATSVIPHGNMTLIENDLTKGVVWTYHLGRESGWHSHTHPNIFSSVLSFNPDLWKFNTSYVVIKMALFTFGLFWWDVSFDHRQSELIYFSTTSMSLEKLNVTFVLAIKLLIKKKYSWIRIQLANQLKVYKILIPINYTLDIRATITSSDCLLYVGFSEPKQDNVADDGMLVLADTRYYLVANASPIYLAIMGNGSVELSLTSTVCNTWHGDSSWSWDRSSCTVQNDNLLPQHVSCLCHRASLFSAASSRPTINLKSKTNIVFPKLERFPHVSVVIWLVATVFIILFLSAILIDVKQKKLSCFFFLNDNYCNDGEVYLIVVQTGVWMNAGTTAHVSFQVNGANRVSRVHVLNIDNDQVLRRNTADCFVMLTPEYLGDILFIRIWHDSFGLCPDWFCDTIVIWHVASHSRYDFVISRWFSLVRSPGTVRGLFKPLRRGQSIPFRVKLEECMRNSHSYLGFYHCRRTPTSCTEHVVVTFVSVLSTAAAILCMMNHADVRYCDFLLNLTVSVVIGTIVSMFVHHLVHYSRPYRCMK